MQRFKLKPGLTFTTEGTQYLVQDQETHSTFRVGQVEYQILCQFEEKTNLEEVRYLFRTQYGREVPHGTLYGFIHKAIELNILEAETDSLWNRLAPATAFTFQFNFFNPTAILDRLLRRGRALFGGAGLVAGAVLLGCAAIVLLTDKSLLAESLHVSLGKYLIAAAAVVCFAFQHEMAHGLAARRCGFEVKSIGFHLHYFMPSLYCKILRPANANRWALLTVLLAGSACDLLGVAGLVCVWWLIGHAVAVPALGAAWVGTIVAVMLLKVLLVQLNPLWFYSDGYYAAGLLFGRRFAALRNWKRSAARE